MIYKYKNFLKIILDDLNNICNIYCSLPIIGEGNDRIVYDLGNNKVLKVARHIQGSIVNYEEVGLAQDLKDKDWFIRVPFIYDYEKDYALWIVAEKINMENSNIATNIALKYIPILDIGGDNVGFSNKGDLVIVDVNKLDIQWFLKKNNIFYHKYFIL